MRINPNMPADFIMEVRTVYGSDGGWATETLFNDGALLGRSSDGKTWVGHYFTIRIDAAHVTIFRDLDTGELVTQTRSLQ